MEKPGTSKSDNLQTRADLPKLVENNASKISKTCKVSTKIDEMRRIWEIEKNVIDP